MADKKFTYTIEIKSEKLGELGKLETKINEIKKAQKSLDRTTKEGSEEYQKHQIELKKTQAELRKNQKEVIDLAKANLAGKGSINQLSIELAKNKNRYRELSAEQRKNKKIGGQLLTTIKKQDTAIKKLDKTIGNSQRNVGNYSSAFSGLGAVLGVGGVAFGLIRAFKDVTSRIIAFDDEMQGMAGIAGTTREELSKVEETITKVAGESIKTSNEVAALATSLFTLGKTKEEVILMLKPVNDLAIALKTTSEESADFLGQTLNAFGKGADSAQEFADIIANIRSSTSLDFEKIKDGFGFLAPTANALNLTIGDTGAILGTLQDNGIKAARAGRLMNSSFAKLLDTGLTLEQALEKINTSTDKVKTASELFGKQSFSLGLILADNIEKTAALADEFDNLSTGSLKKLTDEQLKSIQSQLLILDSTWEKFILGLDSGSGILSRSFRGIISVATKLVESLDEISRGTEGLVSDRAQENLDTFFLSIQESGEDAAKALSKTIESTKDDIEIFNEALVESVFRRQLRLEFGIGESDRRQLVNLKAVKVEELKLYKENLALIEKAKLDAIKAGEDAAKAAAQVESDKIKQEAEDEAAIVLAANEKQAEEQKKADEKKLEESKKQTLKFNEQKKELQDSIDISNTEGEEEKEALKLALDLENHLASLDLLFDNETEKNELKKLLLEEFNADAAQIVSDAATKAAIEKAKVDAGVAKTEAKVITDKLKFEQQVANTQIQIAKQLKGVLIGLLGDSLGAQLASIALDAVIEVAKITIATNAAIAINTANATAASIPTLGASLVAAGITNAALLATSQVSKAGVIAAAAVSGLGATLKLAKGGEIGGKKHSQGGTLIEAEHGEVVINAKAAQANKPLLSVINQSAGNGVAIGTPISSMAATGGLVARGSGISRSQNINVNSLSQAEIQNIVNTTLDSVNFQIGITDINRIQKRVEIIEIQSSL